jgi:2-oxoglutarate dehydrogenase E2 component (dihydrolipoamide succinyltransferase)
LRKGRDTRQFLSPAVRSAARELGVDPRSLLGRGTGGRVTRADVFAAAPHHDDETVPFDNIRKRTAAALLASKQTAAHASTVTRADYSGIEAVRRAAHLTALAFVARAVVDALREFPLMNATTNEDGTGVTVHHAVHLGIAVDLDFKGLVVPVVHYAEGLRLRALADAIRDVATKARARKLTPDDLSGGTFTVTNPGASGTWISVPIINRPQVAILATDGVSKQVVCDNAEGQHASLRVAPIGHLCLSFDHRALDGAYAGAFVERVRQIVETRDWRTEL